MRNSLYALTDELRRLKNAGVKTVSVSDDSIAILRRVLARRAAENRIPETGKRKLEAGRRGAVVGNPESGR